VTSPEIVEQQDVKICVRPFGVFDPDWRSADMYTKEEVSSG